MSPKRWWSLSFPPVVRREATYVELGERLTVVDGRAGRPRARQGLQDFEAEGIAAEACADACRSGYVQPSGADSAPWGWPRGTPAQARKAAGRTGEQE